MQHALFFFLAHINYLLCISNKLPDEFMLYIKEKYGLLYVENVIFKNIWCVYSAHNIHLVGTTYSCIILCVWRWIVVCVYIEGI